MRDVISNDVVCIYKCSFALGVVIMVVEVETLTHEVETVEMVEAFYVGREAATVFGRDADVGGGETG
jgi:hypothetical protein